MLRSATVISSDNSFDTDGVTGPTLVFTVTYLEGHVVKVVPEWSYRSGARERRISVLFGPGHLSYRRPFEETRILSSLAGAPLVPSPLANFTLSGQSTVTFTVDTLPFLRTLADVRVDCPTATPNYRKAGTDVAICVTTEATQVNTDWFDMRVSVTVDGHVIRLVDVFTAVAYGQPFMILADGTYFDLDLSKFAKLKELIDEAKLLHDAASDDLRVSAYQADFWQELMSLGIVAEQADSWRERVGGLLAIDSVGEQPTPATLDAELRPYQHAGFSWLAFLWQHHLGGILADDMGLGKTVQALALITHARSIEPDAPPFLIVAPTSVVPNWISETHKFAPSLRIVSVTETMAKSGRDLALVTAGADIVITSYTLFRLDIDAHSALEWTGLILDEAQVAKNHHSQIYKCVRQLDVPFKLAITGTPMENNVMELWALLSITAPGLFAGPGHFIDNYRKPIESGKQPDVLARLRSRVRPLVLRRTKDQVVQDLPPKQEQILQITLNPEHRRIYETHLARERQKVVGLLGDLDGNRFVILRSITLLRQLCLDASLVDPDYASVPSSKIDALVTQLQHVIDGGHRALVFSQFTGLLTRVCTRLAYEGIEYVHLDGSTRNRGAVLADFKSGTAPVFVISLKAGGVGLNLTEADYCFILAPWWNPATEAQAVDRTHRIGQTKPVMVYRMIAERTIEEKIMAIKERKATLFTSVMDEGEYLSTALDADDIRGLFERLD